MKIFILTEGGREAGFGHIARCISLYEAFLERGIAPEFLMDCDESAQVLLKDTNIEITNWTKGKDELLKRIDKNDIIVIDSYVADKSLYDEVSDLTCGKIVMIDDYSRLDYPEGIVINPCVCGEEVSYSSKDNVRYLLGKDYIILRKEFWNIPKKEIKKEIKDILITFGGIRRLDLMKSVTDYLSEKRGIKLNPITRASAKEMKEAMLDADLCISGGGQTTNELARVGLPTISISFADNQRFNLKGWQDRGFVEYAGAHTDPDLLENINSALDKLFSFEERNKRSQIGRKSVDGKGAKRIVEAALKGF
ncbi:PseG/SpsG family protein [Candidatus Omnitrophota bacterium]